MEIFGIGPMELLLILIIALMVFGPDKLPEIGAKLGKGLREMRQATRQFSQEIEQTREAIEAPIKEVSEPLREAAVTAAAVGQAVAHPTDAIRGSLMRNLGLDDIAGKTESQPPEAATTAIGFYAEVALEAPDETAIGQAIGAPSAAEPAAAASTEPTPAAEAPQFAMTAETPAVIGAPAEPAAEPVAAVPAEPAPTTEAPAPFMAAEAPALIGAPLEPEPTPEPLPASLAPAPLRPMPGTAGHAVEGTDATLTHEA